MLFTISRKFRHTSCLHFTVDRMWHTRIKLLLMEPKYSKLTLESYGIRAHLKGSFHSPKYPNQYILAKVSLSSFWGYKRQSRHELAWYKQATKRGLLSKWKTNLLSAENVNVCSLPIDLDFSFLIEVQASISLYNVTFQRENNVFPCVASYPSIEVQQLSNQTILKQKKCPWS